MEFDDRCSPRQLIRRLALPVGLVVMAVLAPSSVAAQGTRQQRALCEDEARWLCSNYVPDESAITACMVRNRSALSPPCRALFSRGAKQRKRGARQRE
jgi:hypothetical protein